MSFAQRSSSTLLTSLLATACPLAETAAAPQMLDPLVVSSNRAEQPRSDLTGSMTVITASQIEEQAIQTLPEALNRLAGLPVVSNGGLGASTSVLLRGHDSKRLLLLVDGVRFNDASGLSGPNWQHLLISDIERIEILPSAQGALWGADAGAGVINIITKSAAHGTHGSLGYSLGTLGQKHTQFSAAHGSHKFDVRASLQQLSSDEFSSITPMGKSPLDYEKDGYRNQTANLKLGLKLGSDDRLEAAVFWTDADTRYDSGSANSPMTGQFGQNSASLSYMTRLGEWKTRLSVQKGGLKRQDFMQGSKTWESDVQLDQYLLTLSRNDTQGQWSLGAEHIAQDASMFTSYGSKLANGNYSQQGIYAARTHKFTLPGADFPTLLNLGLRADEHSEYRGFVGKHLGIKQYWSELGYLAINLGDSRRAPTLNEQFGPFNTSPRSLQPETITSQEVTLGWGGISLTRFDDQVDHLIDYGAGGYANLIGTSHLKGWEWKWQQALPSLSSEFSLGYQTLDATNASGERLARRPADSTNLTMTYLGLDKTSLSLQAQHNGSRHDYRNQQGPQTGNYWLWHANASYQLNKATRLFLKGINLTDERIMQATNYYPVWTDPATTYYAYSPRTLTLGAEWRF